MSRFPIAIGASLVASLFGGCATQTAEVPVAQAQPRVMRGPPDINVPKEQIKVTLEKIQQVQKAYPSYRAAVATPGFQCVVVDDVCSVKVTVFQATDNSTNLKYCIAIAPEYVIIRGKNQAKRILWELELVNPQTGSPLPWSSITPTGSTLDFLGDGDRGILLLQNIYEGGNPNKPQLKDGKRGKTPTDPTDKTKFHMKNEHKENGTATYLPVVVHTDNGQPSLCGTPDPIIYNVQ